MLDKIEKIDRVTLVQELCELGLEASSITAIESFLNAEETLDYFIPYAVENKFVRDGLAELRELRGYLEVLGF